MLRECKRKLLEVLREREGVRRRLLKEIKASN